MGKESNGISPTANASFLKRLVMRLRQKACALRGHNSDAFPAYRTTHDEREIVWAVRLVCKDCGYTTKWFYV